MQEQFLPRISVITPAYNASEYLSELLVSVANQDYPNVEHIVINDGSNDNGKTENILINAKNIIWWNQPNEGQYATINNGIKKASGDYIIIISADDYFASPYVFSNIVKQCNGILYDVVYGYHTVVNSSGLLLPNQVKPIRPVKVRMMKYKGYVSHCDMFVSSKYLISNKLWWNPRYRYSGDWDWVARVFSNAESILSVDINVCNYRRHDGQISVEKNNKKLRYKEVREISKDLGGNIVATKLVILYSNIVAAIKKRLHCKRTIRNTNKNL